MERTNRYRVGLIRVVTQEAELRDCHGKLLEQWFPQMQVTSRCIEDQTDGVHDLESELRAVPKIVNLAQSFIDEGMEAVIISCAGDPAVELLRQSLSIPVIGAGESTAAAAARLGQRVGVLGITPDAPPAYGRILGTSIVAAGQPDGVECTSDLLTEAGKRATICQALAYREMGAEVLALSCTGMATVGLPAVLARETGMTVLNPVLCEGIFAYEQLLSRRTVQNMENQA